MYEGDTPNAERRAAALSLDRDLLRELLGQEELRDLIDPGALEQVEADLQHRSDRTRAETRDALADVLRRVGDLTTAEAQDRVLAGIEALPMLEQLEAERRAVRLRVGGEQRWVAADDAGLYRDALGVVPPSGLPEAFVADVEAPLRSARRALGAHARPVHHERAERPLRRRHDQRARASSSATATSSAASCGPAGRRASGATPRCCAGCAARRWRCCARRSRRPTSARSPRSCPSWQGVDRHPAAGAGVDRLREVLVPLQGLALPADVWEKEVLPRRCGAYSPAWLDQLCASGEVVWVGAGSLGRNSGRVALYFREDAAAIGPPPNKSAEPPAENEHERHPRAPGAGAVLLHRPAGRAADLARGDPGGAVGPRLGRRGHQRRVGAAARAAPHPRPGAARAQRRVEPPPLRVAAGPAPRPRCRAAGR